MMEVKQALLNFATECHHSSVRYLVAGMYVDCIETILEGLGALEVTLVNDYVSIHTAADNDTLPDPTSVVDKSPVDLSYEDIKSRSDLLIALLYNLALAYHLHALTLDEKQSCYRTLEDAFKLYREVERRLRIRDSICIEQDTIYFISPSLENNIRHLLSAGLVLEHGCSPDILKSNHTLSTVPAPKALF